MIPASKVQEIIGLGWTSRQLLQELATHVKQYACAPISRFMVGAVGLAESGNVYLGVNVEFEGLGLGFCT
jgi:cytidine deaminase